MEDDAHSASSNSSSDSEDDDGVYEDEQQQTGYLGNAPTTRKPIGSPVRTSTSNTLRRVGSARHLTMARSLSKRLVRTISELAMEDKNDEETDSPTDDETESSDLGDPQHDDRPMVLSRSMSKRLIRTISQMFEDESVDNSLDIFGDGENHSVGAPEAISVLKWAPIADGKAMEGSDGFDKLMVSLMQSESFQNSLNNWMGSLSDVFDDKKRANASSRLSEKDYSAMKDTKAKRMNNLGQYLSHSLSCRGLMATLQEDHDPPSGPRNSFQRSQSCRSVPNALLEEEEEESSLELQPWEESASSFDTRPSSSSSSAAAAAGSSSLSSMSASATTATSKTPLPPETRPWEGAKKDSDSLQVNAPRPVRLPSPIKSPRKLNIRLGNVHENIQNIQDALSINLDLSSLGESVSLVDDNDNDRPKNVSRHQRLPSPVKSPRDMYVRLGAERVGLPMIQNL